MVTARLIYYIALIKDNVIGIFVPKLLKCPTYRVLALYPWYAKYYKGLMDMVLFRGKQRIFIKLSERWPVTTKSYEKIHIRAVRFMVNGQAPFVFNDFIFTNIMNIICILCRWYCIYADNINDVIKWHSRKCIQFVALIFNTRLHCFSNIIWCVWF